MMILFLLGIVSRRADNVSAILAVLVGVLVIGTMSFSGASWMPELIRSPLNSLTTTVVGTLTIFLVGLAVGRLKTR